MSARSIYLAGALGVLEPAKGDVSVLLLGPLGWEDMCSYRPRRAWAHDLAAAGHPVVRLDLPGTGDAAGDPHDAGLLDAWTLATGEAAAWLRAQGARRVVALGLGAGGLVAWRAAARGAAIDDLVLWAVPSTGRALVRELRAFARLEASKLGAEPGLPDGTLGAGGFALGPDVAAALAAIDLAALPLPGAATRRMLLLERDGIAVDQRLRTAAQDSGADVRVVPGPGFGAMTALPQEARAPRAVFETLRRWLGEGDGHVRIAPPSAPVARDVLELGSVRETSFTAGPLRGILAEPGRGVARAPLCAVLLNAGAIRRVGPGRMWVEASRRWAARGVPTLRLDLEGIGDSDGDDERYEDVAELYVPALVDQVLAALDALEARGLPPRFVVAGLCAGAHQSFHAALRDQRVASVALLNPRALFWDPAIDAARDARKAGLLLSASSWRRIVTGDLRPSRVLAMARWVLLAPIRLPLRARARRARVRELEQALERLRASRTQVLLGFSGDEPLHEELIADGALERLEDSPTVTLARMPGADHTFRPLATHSAVHELLDRALFHELARTMSSGAEGGDERLLGAVA